MDQNDPRAVDERNLLHDDALDSSRYPTGTTNGTAHENEEHSEKPSATVPVRSAAPPSTVRSAPRRLCGQGRRRDREEVEKSTGGDCNPR